MVKKVLLALLAACSAPCLAQSGGGPFSGLFQNDEYEVYLRLNVYGEGIEVPNHELFGPLPGYLGKRRNNFFWLVTAAKDDGRGKAELSLINDYGSEDLTATLTMRNDSVFELRQEDGSQLKVANNGKWLKLPKKIELKKRK